MPCPVRSHSDMYPHLPYEARIALHTIPFFSGEPLTKTLTSIAQSLLPVLLHRQSCIRLENNREPSRFFPDMDSCSHSHRGSSQVVLSLSYFDFHYCGSSKSVLSCKVRKRVLVVLSFYGTYHAHSLCAQMFIAFTLFITIYIHQNHFSIVSINHSSTVTK